MDPLLILMSILTNPVASVKIFRLVWWPNGIYCPECKKSDNVKKSGKYRKHLQRYHCKTCEKSFNDKTGTDIHYKHIGLGQWMMLVWGFFGGLANGLSIKYLSREIGSYSTVYCMIKNLMIIIRSLATVKLSGPNEHDKMLRQGSIQGN